jgi:Putative capsular polysaccharide synthesis protein
VPSFARDLARRSYWISKKYAQRKMRDTGPRRIVVFTMGKTGSTAIAHAVSQATGRRAFQVFRLNPESLAAAERRYLDSNRDARRAGHAPAGSFPGALHLWESEFLVQHMPSAESPWDVITTVREPVAQAVSAFFHGGGRRGVLDGVDAAALTERMLAEDWLSRPARWFERELGPALGIDVFSSPFDHAAGSTVIEAPNLRLLMMRQEDLDRAPEALRDFLALPRAVPLAHRNVGERKDYADLYRAFMREVCFPSDVLARTYATTYSRHFYTEEELARFRAQWGTRQQE